MTGHSLKEIVQTSTFKADLKRLSKSGRHKKSDFERVVDILLKNEDLAVRYKDHPLRGEWKDYRECHIKPDWLLIYKNEEERLTLVRMGSHSDLFE